MVFLPLPLVSSQAVILGMASLGNRPSRDNDPSGVVELITRPRSVSVKAALLDLSALNDLANRQVRIAWQRPSRARHGPARP